FMADYNARFAKAPANNKDLHRPPRAGDDLDEAFAWKEERTLSCPRPWKNASAEDGGSTSIDQVMARAALIQDLRPGLLAVAVRHR
ncbi:MAG TPA: hypothetical protein VE109_08820, partial [Acidobacteriaceae bacterium]|nr:hypothetical protein [Acidobacteriaceae bacterium]